MNRRPPSYRLHKPSGQAVVTLNGRDVYLGKHGSPESQAEYDRLVAEWLVSGRGKAPALASETGATVAEIAAAFWRHCEVHYEAVSSRHNIHEALKPLKRLYAHTEAAKFGPLALKVVRASMVSAGLARNTINDRIRKIKMMFGWAVENELLPGSVHHALTAVKGIRRGRDNVKESSPVGPVEDKHVNAALPFLPATVRAMVEIQRLTGMRPGEVCSMKTGEIDRKGAVWIYTPPKHKTMNSGKVKQVPIGPKGQAILTPWLKANPAAYLFSPREAVERRNEARRAARKTPMTPSQRARKPKAKPKRQPRERYDPTAYMHAVRRACARAGVPHWFPNQLRHSLASEVRRRFGLEAAQVVLGHSRADVTQVYAERNLSAAVDVMREIG